MVIRKKYIKDKTIKKNTLEKFYHASKRFCTFVQHRIICVVFVW